MLVRVGFRTPGVLIAAIAALVLVTLVSVNSELTGAFGAIAGLWFAVHQVPLSISGTSLGVLPLLPTLVLVSTVARGVRSVVSETSTRRTAISVFGAAVLGPVVVTAVALAVAADASATIGLASPNALVAFGWVAAVHAVGAGIGLGFGMWRSAAVLALPDWVRDTLRPTVRAAMVLVAGASAVVLVSMVASWSTTEMLLSAGNGFVGVLGLTVLSILYLPNVVLGSLAVSVGSAAQVGEVSVSIFHTTGGPLPPLPMLAVLPEGAAQSVWFLMLVVPLAAGVLLGRDCAHRTFDVHYALSSVWLGAAGTGVATLVLGFAAGGNLGTFGTVEVTVWSLGLLTFAWLAVIGSVSAAYTAWRGGSKQPEPSEVPVPVAPVPAAAPAEPVVHEDRALEAEIVEEPQALADPTDETRDVEVVEAEVVEVPAVDDPVVDDPAVEAVVEEAVAETPEPVDAETTEDLPDTPSDRSD